MHPSFAGLDWPRRTERLLLRPATMDDARAFFEYHRLPEVAQWLSSRATDWNEYRARFMVNMHQWLVVELAGQLIGGAKIDIQDAWAQVEVAELAQATQAELGWTFHPDHFGRGYATEVVGELLAICFEGLGLRRVFACCLAENIASWKVMEKRGMRREAHFVRESLHRDGTWRDGYLYALLAEEWTNRQATSGQRRRPIA